MRRTRNNQPSEYSEQVIVCDWLRLHGIVFCAVPNGSHLAGDGKQRAIQMARLKKSGLQPGFPDLLIFTRPPEVPHAVGAAIEMKRNAGGKMSPLQLQWMKSLEDLGWECIVGYGAKDAITELEGLGYGARR